MKSDRVNPSKRPYFQGNPWRVIFRYGTQLLRGCYHARLLVFFVEAENLVKSLRLSTAVLNISV